MTATQPLELLSDIKEGSDEYEHAIFGTYTFDPAFFEGKVLPILQRRDTENILVLVDRSEYEQRFTEVKLAGREYYLDYCKCAKTFHPKFVLLTWPEGGKLLVGSANLTDNAWLTAGELFVSLEFNAAEAGLDVRAVFWEMKKFLAGLLTKNLLKSYKHRAKVEEVLSQTRWLAELGEQKPSSKIRLLHNLDLPILGQVFDQIGDERIREVEILSPFFDPGALVLKEFLRIGCKNLTLYVQPEKTVGFPKGDILEARKKGVRIRVVETRFNEEENRFIHAKFLIFKTNKAVYCLFGSANATRAGLLSTVETGNIELCILRKEHDNDYFKYLLDTKVFELREIDPENVQVQSAPELGPAHRPELTLTDAHLEAKELIIGFEPTVQGVNAVEVQLRHQESETPIRLQTRLQEGRIVKTKLEEKTSAFCSEPTFASISIVTKDKTLNSDRRWISTQALELVPRRRDVERIKETNGRFGLITLFNQLHKAAENPEWFLYYIQWVDFESLGESLNWARRQLLKRIASVEEGGEAELEERPEVDVRRILERIIHRHRRHFEKCMSEIRVDEGFPITLENLFNMFMFLNKVTLWFVVSGRSEIQELRHIRTNLEEFSDLLQELKGEVPEKQLRSLIWGLQIPAHLILLCFVVDDLQRRRGYTTSVDAKWVVAVFRETYTKVLRLCADIGKPHPLKDMWSELAEAIKEYEEFEDIGFDLAQVVRFTEEVLSAHTNASA
jgi:HKD family nuclease